MGRSPRTPWLHGALSRVYVPVPGRQHELKIWRSLNPFGRWVLGLELLQTVSMIRPIERMSCRIGHMPLRPADHSGDVDGSSEQSIYKSKELHKSTVDSCSSPSPKSEQVLNHEDLRRIAPGPPGRLGVPCCDGSCTEASKQYLLRQQTVQFEVYRHRRRHWIQPQSSHSCPGCQRWPQSLRCSGSLHVVRCW